MGVTLHGITTEIIYDNNYRTFKGLVTLEGNLMAIEEAMRLIAGHFKTDGRLVFDEPEDDDHQAVS